MHLPRTWPLARLTLPLKGLSKQIHRLLEGYCFQILGANRDPEASLTRTLNCSWHRSFGSCRCIGNYASDRAPLPKELVVARGWSRLYVRKTRSRKERGSPYWDASPEWPRGIHPMVWVVQLKHALCLVPSSWAPMEAEGGSPIHSMVGPPQSLSRPHQECILGTNTARALLFPVRQWRRLTALRWSTRSENGHYQVQQLCRYSTSAVESSGLNWTTKLYWTVIRCCRRVSFVMCFAEVFSCVAGRSWRKAHSWYPAARPSRCGWLAELYVIAEEPVAYLYNSGLSLRRSLNRSSAKSGAGYRPGICGWRSSCGGGCLLTEWRGVLADRMYVKAPTGKP